MNKIEKRLKQYKEQYNKVSTDYLKEFGWDDLKRRIETGELPKNPWRLYPGRFLYLSAIALIIFGSLFAFIRVASASLPGDPLYKVKRFSENLIISISGQREKQVEERAKEIIDLSEKKKEDEKRLQEAVEEYKESVERIEKEAKRRSKEKRQEIKKKLDEQQKRLEEVLEQNKRLKKEIKKKAEDLENDKIEEIKDELEEQEKKLDDKLNREKNNFELEIKFGE